MIVRKTITEVGFASPLDLMISKYLRAVARFPGLR